VKLSSTFGNIAAGFIYYSCDHAVHNIVALLSLASCLYITSLLPNIINFVQFDAQNLDHQLLPVANYCQSLETFKFWSAVVCCGSRQAFNSGTEGFIEVVKFRVINI